jgi:hypothetical protein
MTFNKGPLSVGRLFQVSITFAPPTCRQLNHPHGGRTPASLARPAFKRCLYLPDRRFTRSANRIERNAASDDSFWGNQACQIITLRKLLYLY